MKTIILAFTLAFTLPSMANSLPPSTEQEISHLFSYLENSDCRFNRNGHWYTTKEAVEHINSKYRYLLDKDLVSDTESFIARAATKSSMSGKAYLVQCGTTQPQPSGPWFKTELARYRKAQHQHAQ